MIVIAGHRRSGRTMELIGLCAEAEDRREVSYIVVHSQEEASRVFRLAQEMGYKGVPFPITTDEFLKGEYAGYNIQNFFIDNVELLLSRLLPTRVNISAIAITANVILEGGVKV